MTSAIHKYFDELGVWLVSVEGFLRRSVDRNGIPLAIVRNDYSDEIVLNDFLYYCVTKSCKTLGAVNNLIKSGYPEDALILVRSIYENYLSIAYVFNMPSALDEFVYKRIGFSTGYLVHPTSARGRSDRRKLMNPETGELYHFGVSMNDLAHGTRNNIDAQIFDIFYPYICEHVHTNMMASGNYRSDDSSRYSYSETDNVLQARFYCVLVISFLLKEYKTYKRLGDIDKDEISTLISQSIKAIQSGFEVLNFEESPLGMLGALQNTVNFLKDADRCEN